MNTKLEISISEGTVLAEGSEEFVRFIYQDFKDNIAKHLARPFPQSKTVASPSVLLLDDAKAGKKKTPHKPKTGDAEKARSGDYKPKFVSSLNLAGLDVFYAECAPTNNYEKILVFSVFLRDRVQIEPCSADDIYTCFFTLKNKTKIPEAFLQSFRDAQSRTHFIDFVSVLEIRVTIAGDNYFSQKLQKKG